VSPFKIDFERLPWQQIRPDVRQKIYCEGSRQVRLVEFDTSDAPSIGAKPATSATC
jgi:hypothetical protein